MLKTRAAIVAIVMLAPLGISTPAQAAKDCSKLPVPTANQALVAEIQLRLSATGRSLYPNGDPGPATKAMTRRWEKANGVKNPDGRFSPAELKKLRAQTSGTFSFRVDKSEQKMYVGYQNKRATYVNVSTASGRQYTRRDGSTARSVTPTGNFRIYRTEQGWYTSKSLDGCLYSPRFFTGGIAVHGSMSVPYRRPSSAGCVRVTPESMAGLSRVMEIGDSVIVNP